MSGFDELKSKVTYENKTIFGIVGIIVGFMFWGIGHPGIGIGDVLILIFPAILLMIPNETIKNSKVLAIISIIILLLFLFVGLASLSVIISDYLPTSFMFYDGYVESMLLSNILQLILCIYGLFCAFLLTIQTKPQQSGITTSATNNNQKYDKYCQKCGHGLFNGSKFCPGCGTKLTEESESEEEFSNETEEKKCRQCGFKLDDDYGFCPECGTKLTGPEEK